MKEQNRRRTSWHVLTPHTLVGRFLAFYTCHDVAFFTSELAKDGLANIIWVEKQRGSTSTAFCPPGRLDVRTETRTALGSTADGETGQNFVPL